MSLIRICVGGFDIQIEAFDRTERNNILKTYKRFVSRRSSRPPIHILTHRAVPGIFPSGDIFSLSDNWSMYRHGKDYCIELRNIEKNNLYTTNLAVFNGDFLKGDVYTQRRRKTTAPAFSFPLDQIFFIHLLALRRGILVHGCSVKYRNKGLLFLGPSGAGKSTIGGLFLRFRDAAILNDDKTIIRRENGKFFIYGTPWHGTLASHSRGSSRLKAVFFLKKSSQNRIIALRPFEAMARLASLTFFPYGEKKFTDKALGTIASLGKMDIFFELEFTPGADVLDLIDNDFKKSSDIS